MARIQKIKDNENVEIYPVTHERGVWDSLGRTLESKLKDLEIVAYESMTPEITTGKCFLQDGSISTNSTYTLWKIVVEAGKVYAFSAARSSTANQYIIGWYNSSDTLIKKEYKNTSSVIYRKKEIIAPEGAAYVLMNVQNYYNDRYDFFDVVKTTGQEFYDSAVKKADVVDSLDSTSVESPLSANQGNVLNEKIKIISYEKLVPSSRTNDYFQEDGTIYTDSTTYRLWKYPVESGSEYAFSGERSGTVNQYLLAWYTSNGTYIKKESYKPTYGVDITYNKQLVVAPEGASFAYLNVQATKEATYAFFQLSEVSIQEFYDNRLTQDDVEDLIDSSSSLPSFYDSYLDERNKKIMSNVFDINQGDYFGFITDTHPSGYYNKRSGLLYRYMMSKMPLRKVIFGGDIGPNNASNYGAGTTAKDGLIKSLVEQCERLYAPVREIGEIYPARGNHDFSSRMYPDSSDDNTGWQMSNSATRLQTLNDLDNIVTDSSNADANYYYFDNPIGKIRYIVMDSSDSVNAHYQGISNVLIEVSDKQMKWITEQAVMTTPSGYSIIVVIHVPIAKLAAIGTYWSKTSLVRVKNMLIAAKNRQPITIEKTDSGATGNVGTYDFSSFGANVLMVLSGHTHCDEQTYEGGVLFITSASDFVTNENTLSGIDNAFDVNTPSRESNSIYEDLLNVLVADTGRNIVRLFRIGPGCDRVYNVTKHNVSVGGTIELTSQLTPTLEWFSYDATQKSGNSRPITYMHDFASVNNGVVTGVAVGESVVVAYSETDNCYEFFNVIVS